MIFFNISETIKDSDFKIYHEVVVDGKFWVMFGSRFLDNGSINSEKVYSFGNCDSRGSFPFMQSVRQFCSLTQKMGLKWAYRRQRITQMADLIFSETANASSILI